MLKVTSAKGLGLVSDLGRFGMAGSGVAWTGALDLHSLQLANVYLGNHEHAACVEFMGRFSLQCVKPCVLLLSSALGLAKLNDLTVEPGRTLHLTAGDELEIFPPQRGVWTQLAVQGGVQVPSVLGSRSTHLQAGFGGLEGRTLRVGDHIPTLHLSADLNCPGERVHRRLALPVATWNTAEPLVIRFVEGPEMSCLPKKEQARFCEQSWSLGLSSSRMGFRFEGRALKTDKLPDMRSHAVHPGVIQLPPAGRPLVLMADAQVTGGYPRLGSVIQADLWKLTQLSPGQSVIFKPVELSDAVRAQKRLRGEVNRLRMELFGA